MGHKIIFKKIINFAHRKFPAEPNFYISYIIYQKLAAGTVGSAYSTDATSTNAQGTVTYSITSGSLPTGLTLSGSTISGTPTSAGTYTFTLQATDTGGWGYFTNSTSTSITISAAATPPTASPKDGTVFSNLSGTVTLSSPGASAIYYTTDGTDPTCSTGTLYSTVIAITSATTIKSVACNSANTATAVQTFSYIIVSVASGGGSPSGGGSTTPPPVTPPVTTSTPPVATSTPPVVPPVTPPTPPTKQEQLLTLINTLRTLITQLQAKGIAVAIPPGLDKLLGSNPRTPLSSMILPPNSTSDGVRALQQFLIDQAKGTASTALKNYGVTGYFGNLTKQALSEFQESVGILPATGTFGPKTREYLKGMGE